MEAGLAQPPGSVGHSVAIEICHSIRVQNAYYRDRVIWCMDELFRGDPAARKRFKPDQRTGIKTSKFAGLVQKQDAVEQKERLMQRMQWRALFVLPPMDAAPDLEAQPSIAWKRPLHLVQGTPPALTPCARNTTSQLHLCGKRSM
eukprot:237665-Amphidinium_carterae.2